MYGQWEIDIEETLNRYGYRPSELTYGSTKPVAVVCKECGTNGFKRLSEATRKHRCPSILDGKKYCFRCKLKKLVTEFSKNRSTRDGYQKICKDCFSIEPSVVKGYQRKYIDIKSDVEKLFKFKYNTLKSTSKARGIPFEISPGFLYDLFVEQEGRCYYTNRPLLFGDGVFGMESVSIDKLEPAKGYVVGNVVLCTFGINSMKNYLTESQFIDYVKTLIPQLQDYVNRRSGK